jgi:hypothetical protein
VNSTNCNWASGFGGPIQLALDYTTGTIYVADRDLGRVCTVKTDSAGHKFSSSLTFSPFFDFFNDLLVLTMICSCELFMAIWFE